MAYAPALDLTTLFEVFSYLLFQTLGPSFLLFLGQNDLLLTFFWNKK